MTSCLNKNPLRVYFNRCFTSTAQVIEIFLNAVKRKDYQIFISHTRPNHYLENVADYFEIEPSLTGKRYVNYCLEFCKTHHIDVFIPRYQVETLVKYSELFSREDIKVMFCGSGAIYELLNDKFKTFSYLKNNGLVNLPLTYRIQTYEEFQQAYRIIRDNGSKACVKPIIGIGGEGFKRISEDNSEIEELFISSATMVSYERISRVLEAVNETTPFIVSEYLEDEEYSLDCLADNGKLLISIPRRKIDAYSQVIEYREELLRIAQSLTEHFKLNYLFNIQLRYHRGDVYFIEINTRMSGGLFKACYSGVNFLKLAIELLLDGEIKQLPQVSYNFQLNLTEIYRLSQIKTN